MRCNYLIHDNGALIYGAASAVPYVRSARLGGGDIRMSRRPSSLRSVQGAPAPCAAAPLSPFPCGDENTISTTDRFAIPGRAVFLFHRRRSYLLCINQTPKSKGSANNRSRAKRSWNSFDTGSSSFKTVSAIWKELSAASAVTASSPVGPPWIISGQRSKPYPSRNSTPSWNGF